MQIQISPEALQVAQTYLATLDPEMTASSLNITTEQVHHWLANKEVKSFINSVFLQQGYNNRFKLAEAMDKIIDAKLLELDEAQVTSSKDIVDILSVKHKMRMDELKLEIELEKAKTPTSQTNVQVNTTNQFGENYSKLIERLVRC